MMMHETYMYLLSLQKSCFQQVLWYSGYVQRTSALTWSEKTKVTCTGQSMVTLQYRLMVVGYSNHSACVTA